MVQDTEDRRWYFLTVAGLLLVACTLRIRALSTTLFEDEVWVANLLRHGGLRPHTYSLPPLYYVLGRVWVSIAGASDAALRLPAAVLGVALGIVPLFAPLSRTTRLLWSSLLLFSSPFLFYSGRVKQYTLEATVGTILLVLYLHAARSERRTVWTAFFVVAAVGVATLHSPLFVLAGLGAATLLQPKMRTAPILAAFGVLAALGLTAYSAFLSPGPTTPLLHGDMVAWFSRTGRWVTSPLSLFRNTRFWTGHAFNLTRGWWLVLVPSFVAWCAAKKDKVLIAAAVIPPTLAAIVSILHLYPYGEVRLLLFAFPALYLVTAEALNFVFARLPWAAFALLLPFIFNAVVRDPYNSTYMKVDDLRLIYATVAKGTDPIMTSLSYAAPLLYYYPSSLGRIRIGAGSQSGGPVWNLQPAGPFAVAKADQVLRTPHVIAFHLP